MKFEKQKNLNFSSKLIQMTSNLGGPQGLQLILAAFNKLSNKVDGIHDSVSKSVDVSLTNFKLQSQTDLERLLSLHKAEIIEMVEEKLSSHIPPPSNLNSLLVTPQSFVGNFRENSANSVSSMSAFSIPSRQMQETEEYLLEEFSSEDVSWASPLSSENLDAINDENAIISLAMDMKLSFITDMRFF